jgi:hypothetical protein
MQRSSFALQLPKPDHVDIEFLRRWLSSPRGGDNFLLDNAAEGTAWAEDQSDDLVALKRNPDRFAAWFANNVMPTYHRGIGHRIHTKVDDAVLGPRFWFDERHFAMLGNAICTIVSSVLPSFSIVLLYYVQDMRVRLMLIVALSTIFSLITGLVAPGRRYEVFAATTAFAAVQVVFVGGVNFVVSTQQPQS